jgi:hypothetical protein
MRRSKVQLCALSALLLAIEVVPAVAQPQYPTELTSCGDVCRELMSLPLILDCDPILVWRTLIGRSVWGPLTYAGPIRVSVQARPWSESDIPLYAEVRQAYGTSCNFDPGCIIWATRGTSSCDPDSLWVSSPWVVLHPWIPLGEPYWIQLVGFYILEDGFPTPVSPGIGCIRVESRPTAVVTRSWGSVKALYRE